MSTDFDYSLHIFRAPHLQEIVEAAIQFFVHTPVHELPPPLKFDGTGVYGVYYIGDHPLYTRLSLLNQDTCTYPIYVGKAVPSGWRTARSRRSGTPALYRRLREHARSITQAVDLRLEDFRCRFVILQGLETDLIIPVEAALIRRFKPLWNTIVDGFGNHDPGAGRYNQSPSEWDVLHPGRPWAARLTGEAPHLAEIKARVQQAQERLSLP